MLNIKNVKELYNNLQLLKYQCPPPLRCLSLLLLSLSLFI
jgi:hypothetical protein